MYYNNSHVYQSVSSASYEILKKKYFEMLRPTPNAYKNFVWVRWTPHMPHDECGKQNRDTGNLEYLPCVRKRDAQMRSLSHRAARSHHRSFQFTILRESNFNHFFNTLVGEVGWMPAIIIAKVGRANTLQNNSLRFHHYIETVALEIVEPIHRWYMCM